MRYRFNIICSAAVLLLFFLSVPVAAGGETEACTSAIINGASSRSGGPMLWKSRDTSFLSNKVIYVKEQPFCYIGLINAKETSGRYVYAGLNSEGFGIINTVAYNLPKEKDQMHDLEGRIMADALRTCRTVDDFEGYIKKNLGDTLGSWANFGVIDSAGNAVIFEVHNHGYKKFNSADTPEKYLINTNFARSGKTGKGQGYLRFERASALFNGLKGKKVTHEFIFRTAARDWGHSLMKHPAPGDLEYISETKPLWIYSRDCINRPSTASVVVINGRKPGRDSSVATMWVLLGEPVTSIAVPVWVEARSTPAALYKGKDAPVCGEALRIKKIIRPFSEGSMKNYMNLTRLINKEKTGFLPLLMQTEKEIFEETAKFLEKNHTPKEYADFQNKIAEKALKVLKTIKK